MPKLPRDISSIELIKLLQRFGYEASRQTGSHIRLTSQIKGKSHHITIPDHRPIRVGTLNQILNDISEYLSKPKSVLVSELFSRK